MSAINKIVKYLNEVQKEKVFTNDSNNEYFQITGVGKGDKTVIRFDNYEKFIEECLSSPFLPESIITFDPFE